MRVGKTILFSLLLLITTNLMAQSPLGINYQGVARSADGTPMINQVIGLRVSITSGPNGSTDYIEEHHPETNEFGLFTVVVGQGQSSGNISDVDWGAGNKWLQIEVDPQDNANYMFVGSQQMMSVPYALYAAKSGESLTPGFGIDITNGQVNNLLPDKPVTLTGSGSAVVSGTYPNFTIATTDNVEDADADPTNEIELPATATANQVLKWNGTDWVAGNDDTNDADTDAANELLQTAVLTGTNLELTDAGGTKTVDLASLQDGTGTDSQTLNTAVLTSDTRDLSISGGNNITLNIADADADATNELLQTAALIGTNLELTDAAGTKTVDLSSLQDGTGTDNQNLTSNAIGTDRTINISGGTGTTFSIDDGDSNATNELQTISKTGSTVTLSNGGGSFTDAVDDADADPTNEIELPATATTNQVLKWNGTAWVAGSDDINDGDTDATNEIELPATATANQVLKWNGTAWIADTDATVDGDASATNEIQDLQLATNTLTITNNGTATPINLAPYLDNTDTQNLTNVLGQGADAGTNKITNLADPTLAQDAATKNYVDTQDALDLDKSATNEFNTAASYEANNTLRITDLGGNVDVALGTLNANLNTNNNNITNLADPVNPQDAVNLQFLEAKDANDYAINVPINYSSVGAGDVALDLQSSATLDKGGLVLGNTITITEAGVYAISIQGFSSGSSDIDIVIDTTNNPVLRDINKYMGTYMFDLISGNQIQIVVRFTTTETVRLQIAIYKI